jgi:uncharacterized coiled-coil protein SlyX
LLQANSAPVWLQLIERFAAETDCQPKVMRSLAQQLAEQRAVTARQQQHIAGLQEQLSAQQHVAAQQGAQIAILQAQLQQVLQHQQQ